VFLDKLKTNPAKALKSPKKISSLLLPSFDSRNPAPKLKKVEENIPPVRINPICDIVNPRDVRYMAKEILTKLTAKAWIGLANRRSFPFLCTQSSIRKHTFTILKHFQSTYAGYFSMYDVN
jgi:hypothetical protein